MQDTSEHSVKDNKRFRKTEENEKMKPIIKNWLKNALLCNHSKIINWNWWKMCNKFKVGFEKQNAHSWKFSDFEEKNFMFCQIE